MERKKSQVLRLQDLQYIGQGVTALSASFITLSISLFGKSVTKSTKTINGQSMQLLNLFILEWTGGLGLLFHYFRCGYEKTVTCALLQGSCVFPALAFPHRDMKGHRGELSNLRHIT